MLLLGGVKRFRRMSALPDIRTLHVEPIHSQHSNSDEKVTIIKSSGSSARDLAGGLISSQFETAGVGIVEYSPASIETATDAATCHLRHEELP
jgi:hypothetical protein